MLSLPCSQGERISPWLGWGAGAPHIEAPAVDGTGWGWGAGAPHLSLRRSRPKAGTSPSGEGQAPLNAGGGGAPVFTVEW